MWKEERIPVAHGHLAARTWGNPSSYPLLAVHGWLDNANSFENLVPLLPKDLFIVCLDFSGHGHSSHLGPGAIYCNVIFLSDIKATIDYFGWKKLALMGHSMGGGYALQFSGLYPHFVENLIILDHLPVIDRPPVQPEDVLDYLQNRIKDNQREQSPPFTQTKEAILQRMEILYKNLSSNSVEILCRRGLLESPEKKGHFYYTRDNRCKSIFFAGVNGMPFKTLKANIIPNYHGRLLCLFASNTSRRFNEFKDKVESLVGIFQKHSSFFEAKEVEGYHHFHMDNAVGVAKEISSFLESRSTVRNKEIFIESTL